MYLAIQDGMQTNGGKGPAFCFFNTHPLLKYELMASYEIEIFQKHRYLRNG